MERGGGVVVKFDFRVHGLGLVANAGLNNGRLGKPFGVADADLGGCEFGLVEVVVGAEDHFVCLGTDGRDKSGMTERDAEAFALAYGVVGVTAVSAKDFAFGIDVVALANDSVIICHILTKERAVVVVGDEAYFLRLFLLGEGGITVLAGDDANLLFGEVAQRENGAAEVVLGEHPEEIGLVLAGVGRAGKIGVIAEGLDAGVMARGDIGTTKFICHAEHLAPFDVGVAENARVGRAAMHVLVDEIANDVFTERVAEVHDMVLEAHALSVVLRLHDAIDRAAAFLSRKTRLLDAVERAEGDAHDFVALLEEEHCANGGVDTAGHSEKNFHDS